MLIVNYGQLRRASIASLEEQCASCSQPEARVPARHRQRYKANRLSCEMKESCLMPRSTDARRMKAAIWCQALRGDTSVSCPIGQVVGIRRRKGQLLQKF